MNFTPASSCHIPVLLGEVMAALRLSPGDIYVDGTYGAGGYARAALDHGAAHVYGFDRDPSVIANAPKDPRITLIEAPFSTMATMLAAQNVQRVDAIALDIGMSSMQIDDATRGFSFSQNGPLDMRMSKNGPSAADFLNHAAEQDIADVIYRYGEEPKSRRLARAIVAARPLENTHQLAELVRRVLRTPHGHKKDPATRVFQAIRIHINDELTELENGLNAAERALSPGGRLAIVSFHSLEDRLVKRFFRARDGRERSVNRHIPCQTTPQRPATFSAVTRAVRPGAAEIHHNPRARSATLRAATRTAAPIFATEPIFEGSA